MGDIGDSIGDSIPGMKTVWNPALYLTYGGIYGECIGVYSGVWGVYGEYRCVRVSIGVYKGI